MSCTTINTIASALSNHRIPGISGRTYWLPHIETPLHCQPQISLLQTMLLVCLLMLVVISHQSLLLEETHLKGTPIFNTFVKETFKPFIYLCIDAVFQNVSISDGNMFRQSIHCFIELTTFFFDISMLCYLPLAICFTYMYYYLSIRKI